jgi:hypothetical protein
MAKKQSMAQRVRNMIDRGYSNKTIIEKLGVKPQMVYNIRYIMNKERGLGAIGKPAPKPTEGIGAPPKRTRRVRAGTGINNPVPEPLPVPPALYEVMGKPFEPRPYAITMVEPEPTWWERLKNLVRAIGGGK